VCPGGTEKTGSFDNVPSISERNMMAFLSIQASKHPNIHHQYLGGFLKWGTPLKQTIGFPMSKTTWMILVTCLRAETAGTEASPTESGSAQDFCRPSECTLG